MVNLTEAYYRLFKENLNDMVSKAKAANSLVDLLDDISMETEMLIDEHYGEMSVDEFKREWYEINKSMEKKLANYIKNVFRS